MSSGAIRPNALPRVWHSVVAAGVLVALVLQVIIAAKAPGSPPAHAVGTLAGAPAAGRLLRVASFFTIQSNILLAVTSAQLALGPQRDGFLWRILRLDALVGIAVTVADRAAPGHWEGDLMIGKRNHTGHRSVDPHDKQRLAEA